MNIESGCNKHENTTGNISGFTLEEMDMYSSQEHEVHHGEIPQAYKQYEKCIDLHNDNFTNSNRRTT